jgi:hypothetical protein
MNHQMPCPLVKGRLRRVGDFSMALSPTWELSVPEKFFGVPMIVFANEYLGLRCAEITVGVIPEKNFSREFSGNIGVTYAE